MRRSRSDVAASRYALPLACGCVKKSKLISLARLPGVTRPVVAKLEGPVEVVGPSPDRQPEEAAEDAGRAFKPGQNSKAKTDSVDAALF